MLKIPLFLVLINRLKTASAGLKPMIFCRQSVRGFLSCFCLIFRPTKRRLSRPGRGFYEFSTFKLLRSPQPTNAGRFRPTKNQQLSTRFLPILPEY